MAPAWHTDVCVIGAGPAGSAIAKRLAELGHSVVVVEKTAFPREHVGICLSYSTTELLNYLGVGEAMKQADFQQRETTLVAWETAEPVQTAQPGFHVDRGVFDQLLLTHACAAGVQLIQPARTTSLQRNSKGGWQVKLSTAGQQQTIHTRFLVDASGRANALGGKRLRYAPPLFALHASWEVEDATDCDGFMEAGEEAWLWMARLKGNKHLISLYTDPKHYAQSGSNSLEAYYRAMLNRFVLPRLNAQKSIAGTVKGCDASSRCSVDPVGADFIRVGDANYSVDPMASQGVHLALSSGIQAAIVVNTLLRYPDKQEIAQQFYRDRQQERVNQFRERTASEYARAAKRFGNTFWQQRAQAEQPIAQYNALKPTDAMSYHEPIQLSPEAMICNTAVLKKEHVGEEPALQHPSFDRPVAYLGGTPLAPLLQLVHPGLTISGLLNSWEKQVQHSLAEQIIAWLWDHQILIPFRGK